MKTLLIRGLLVFTGIAVVLLFVYYIFVLFTGEQKINITSVSPENNSKDQSIFSAVSVTFSRSLSEAEKNKVNISANPKIGDSSWSQDGRSILEQAKQPLETSQTYSITVNYDSRSYMWSFKTVDENHLSESDKALLQGNSDQKAEEDLKKFYQKNPWYDKIPITTSSYFVGFDSAKNNFFVYLYPLKSSSTPVDDQVAGLKTEAISALRSIGANPDPNTIEWIVSPK